MPRAGANGIEIEYDVTGDDADPPLLLIMGLGAQMTSWRDGFVAELAARRFRVIRFDNRDVGLSTFFDDAGVPDLLRAVADQTPLEPVYTLDDMADDAAGLLDALGIERAHIVGASMGGMIAQTFAIRHPQRTLSLCSIMSSPGAPEVQPSPEVATSVLLAPVPRTAEEAEEAAVTGARLIGSPGYPADEAQVRAYVRAAFERSYHPAGSGRQLVAIVNQPDRRPELGRLTCPVLVVHGDADPLVPPLGGRLTAAAVPGAELWIQEGVGHDIPAALYAELADRIAGNCRPAA